MEEQGSIQGNPETSSQESIENGVFGSGESFFDQLEQSVNGMVQDEHVQEEQSTEVTHSESGSDQVTHNESQMAPSKVDNTWDSEKNPYKKRYKDSSRAAVQMNQQLRDLKPFIPVLEAMKKDSGLVNHVRGYLQGGGRPAKNVQEQLGLPEDFEYDSNEAMVDPKSDSAKVLNAHVDQMVQGRVGQMLNREKTAARKMQGDFMKKKHEVDFKKRMNMSEEDYKVMVEKAKGYTMSLDDVYYLLNRQKAAKNVADSTKQDMLTQMKNVRDIPTSASDSNNQDRGKTPDNSLFDGLMELDGGIDNLFG